MTQYSIVESSRDLWSLLELSTASPVESGSVKYRAIVESYIESIRQLSRPL